jgi:hypothetical protein
MYCPHYPPPQAYIDAGLHHYTGALRFDQCVLGLFAATGIEQEHNRRRKRTEGPGAAPGGTVPVYRRPRGRSSPVDARRSRRSGKSGQAPASSRAPIGHRYTSGSAPVRPPVVVEIDRHLSHACTSISLSQFGLTLAGRRLSQCLRLPPALDSAERRVC